LHTSGDKTREGFAMKLTKLPQDLVEVLSTRGLAGRLIYVPKQKSRSLVASHTPKVLKEMEATYEQRGATFYWEASPRKVFSAMFGTHKIISKFHLKPRTATSVASAAYRTWREWFSHKERLKLEQLRSIAEETGWDYSDLSLSYREIRDNIRNGQKIDIGYYTGYHNFSIETVHQIIDLAKASIESCPWRS
jgi:hypothetical protein